MSILPTWPIAAGALALGIACGAYADHTVMAGRIDRMNAAHAEEMAKRQLQRGADEQAARAREQQLAVRAGQIEQDKTNEIARIRSSYDSQLASLQQRAARKPAAAGGVPAPASACAGSTGAELSRPDAEFSLGLAARADEQREALRACYGWADSVEGRLVR